MRTSWQLNGVADRLLVHVGHGNVQRKRAKATMATLKDSRCTYGCKRILIYARYSTDDQNPRSITDQVSSVRRWLSQHGFGDVDPVVESDEGISGEILSRPGINRVRHLVRAGGCDLVVGEDVSRFFRDRNEPGKFVGECVDAGVRFIAMADDVDTENSRWQEILHQVVARYAGDNEDTSRRIKRAAEGRWSAGFAMGPLLPGYERFAVDQLRRSRNQKGPFKDRKDEKWATVITEAFERAARGDPSLDCASFLTSKQFPRRANTKSPKWTARGFLLFIKNPLYKGIERFRATQARKHFGSGKRLPVQSSVEEIMTRDMPHLAFVSPLLWQQANDAITRRNRARKHPKGKANPNFRIPRDSRSPLSSHFFCGVCSGKMIGAGRGVGGYRWPP